jgi:hypothetical protein
MDNPENTPATISSEMEEMKAQYEDLRQLVVTGLAILLFISCVFTLFLWRQAKFAQRDLDNYKPLANQVFAAYSREEPGIQDLARKLAEYGRTHPDFAPISAKYGLGSLTKPGSAPAALPPGSQNKK